MNAERMRTVEALFESALALEPDRRAAFVRESSEGDEPLRHELESLLESHANAAAFFAAPAFDKAVKLLSDDREPSMAGRRIGSYRVIRELGRGGMGAVYLAARDDDQYKKEVAIKVVREGFDNQFIIDRFLSERQILANLDHKNIARLLDGGATQDGSPYLVMEYIEGLQVDDYCERRQLSTGDRLRLFRLVCSAVQYAHQNLVIHRDLKPSNILVTEDGTPKLLDFGIAKILSPEPMVQATNETATAARLMTPDYASPEQVRGDTITTSSDIYSLGVLLYKLLTGQKPYRFKTPLPHEIEQVICDQEPEKPSETSPQSAIRNPKFLRGDLDNIVMMAMRKEPVRRYSSVEQFSDDIRRHLEGLPVLARKDTFAYLSGKFIKRHKLGAAAAAFIALTITVGTVAIVREARIATRQRDRAQAEVQKAEQLNGFLQQMLSSADPSVQGKDITVAHVLGEAANRVETEFSDQPEIAAAMRSTIGMTYLALGLYDAAEPQLRSALEERRNLFGRNHPDVATSLNNLGLLMTERGAISEAEELYREALDISLRVRGPDHLETAAIMHNLAALLVLKGSLDEAEQMNRTELAIRRRFLGNDSPDLAKSLNDLGVVLGTKGDLAGAEELHREALAITRRVYGAEHVNVAANVATLAAILEERGEYVEAEALYREALEMRRKLLGPEHPTVTWTLYNYAYMLERKGDYGRSAELARDVLALRGKTLNDEHPMVASSLQVLGKCLMEQGNASDAEPILRESLTLRRKTMPPDHWLIANSESVLGECLTRLRRFREAEPLLLTGYANLKSRLGEEHSRTRDAAERITRLHRAWNKHDKAM